MTTTSTPAVLDQASDDAAEPTAGRAVQPVDASRPTARLAMPDLALIGAAAGLFGLTPFPAVIKAVLVGLFVFLGPGAAIASWVPVPRHVRLAAIPTLGMSVITIVSIGAMWSYRWNTTAILVLCCAATAGSSVVWYLRHAAAPPVRTWPAVAQSLCRAMFRAPGINAPVVLIVVALILWAVAMPSLPGVEDSFYGLLASGSGRLLIPAVLLNAAGFCWAVASHRTGAAALAVGAAIVIGRVTTWVATEMPLYDWTYKHIAVVRYIIENGLIQPDGTDIYAQWPAFFVTSAWYLDVTGLDPYALAHIFAPIVHVLLVLIVYSPARVVGQSHRMALVAAFIAESVNWVGQDYFSPQAWTLILAFGLMAMLIASRGAPRMAVLAIIPFAAMVPTHQLTPFWVLGAATLLVLFRRVRPWWAVAAMIAIAGAYLALNFDAVAPYGILSGGNPVNNATSNVTMVGLPSREFTSLICRGLSAGVFAAAALATVWAWRTGRRHIVLQAILAFSALGLLLGQSYGGEAIFRVYLYSLLGCSLLIAPMAVALLDGWGRGALRTAGAAVAGAGVLGASLAGLYSFVALWPMVVETRAQVTAMDRITTTAPPGSRFIMMYAGGMPTRTNANYAQLTLRNPYFDYSLAFDLNGNTTSFPTAEQLGHLEWVIDEQREPTFVAFSTQSTRTIEYYGGFSPGAVQKFQDILGSSPQWHVVHRDQNSLVFRHDPPVTK